MEIMKEVKKHENRTKAKQPSAWVDEVIRASEKPLYKSNKKALVAITKKFEELARRMGFSSTEELWQKAEHSMEFKEEYLEALHLKHQISFLKRRQ